MTAPDIASLLTVTGNAVVVAIVVELVKRTLALTEAAKDRFGPILAVGTGIGLAVLAAVATGAAIAPAILVGFLSGALSSGLYSLAKSPMGSAG